jgi:hypothetical protein
MGLAFLSGRSALAGEPPRLGLPALNISESQRLADTIVAHLQQSGQLHHYRVDVLARGGDVELTGTVADQHQREEVLRLVQGVPGVVRVIDHMTLTSASGIKRVQAAEKIPAPQPDSGGQDKSRLPSPLPNRPGSGGPAAPGANGGMVEPAPMAGGPMPGYYSVNPPAMPPYAWPTYAPYNNFSRVAVPEAYPYKAWPFIGPIYPFPKVPLGWREVKLQWDDGYWWYGRVGCKYDWWKLRYW